MKAKEVFVGAAGVRAGWRALIFLGIVIAVQAVLQEIVLLILKARGIAAPEGLYALFFLVSDTIALIAVVIATGIMARWERRKFTDYGLPCTARGQGQRRRGLQRERAEMRNAKMENSVKKKAAT